MGSDVFVDVSGMWQSRWGRCLFLIHLFLFSMLDLYYASHLDGSRQVLANIRLLIYSVDWPTIDFLHIYGFPYPDFGYTIFIREALGALYLAIPWWGYGYFAEQVAEIIRRRIAARR